MLKQIVWFKRSLASQNDQHGWSSNVNRSFPAASRQIGCFQKSTGGIPIKVPDNIIMCLLLQVTCGSVVKLMNPNHKIRLHRWEFHTTQQIKRPIPWVSFLMTRVSMVITNAEMNTNTLSTATMWNMEVVLVNNRSPEQHSKKMSTHTGFSRSVSWSLHIYIRYAKRCLCKTWSRVQSLMTFAREGSQLPVDRSWGLSISPPTGGYFFWPLRHPRLFLPRNLHSHHFSSPLTNQQEVSAFGEMGEGDTGDVWKVMIDKSK